jgi:transposase, IS5 family
MLRVVPWLKLIALIDPHYPTGKTGRPLFPIATMLLIHFMHGGPSTCPQP